MERALRGMSVALLAASVVWGQTGTGSIQGTVKDASGAVLPGAKVTITHTQTSRQFTTTTTEVGFYLFPAAQLGPYEISVEAPGMEIWRGELTLQVGQAAEVNPALKVAGTATEVTVAGNVSPLVTTTSPTLANVVERQRIEQLPLNGRYIQDLLYMTTPGFEASGVPRVFGLRFAVEMLQDSAVLVNRQWQSIPLRPPGLDTIEEFRSETSNSSAKMNRPGTVILTTRAGTNQVHGSVFETVRNSGIGVARRREDFYLKPPHLVRNEFGGSLGGPIYLPKLYNGRNQTFFFFAYEGFRLRQSSTRSVTMPTDAMRNGDFSSLIDSQGRRFTLYDPTTTGANWLRQPFPGNQMPTNRRSPLSTYLYDVTPAPTHPNVNPLVSANWFGLGYDNTNQTTITTRVDHRLSDHDQLFFRYSHNPSHRDNTTSLGGGPTTLDGRANARIDSGDNDSGVASWTHTFSPTFFSETVFSVQRDHREITPIVMEDIATQLGLSNPFKGLGFPRIVDTGFGMDYDSSANLNMDFSRIYNFDQNFTKVYGRHEFQFGGRWRQESLDILADVQQTMGTVSFASLGTAQYDPGTGTAYSAAPFTGHNAANFYLGLATYSARYFPSFFYLRTGERSLYFQDNFKVNSRLTLNLGLRYEYNTPITDRDRTILSFNSKTKAIVTPISIDELVKLNHAHPAIAKAYDGLGVKYESPSQAGLPESLVYANKWDFGPRAGFAYRMGNLSRPTVLRGGYAIYAIPEQLRAITCETRAIVPTTATFANNPNSAQQSPDGLPNYLLRSTPTVIAGVNSQDTLNLTTVAGITRGTGTVYYLDPRQKTARAHEWNITLEREIFENTSARVSYVGTYGTRLAQYYSYNDAPNAYVWYTTTGEPLPTGEYANVATRNFDREIFGTIWQYQKTGWSNDSSFVAEIQHRFSKGYAFQLFYTMSNALRAGGNGWADDILRETNLFLPGAVPTDQQARNRLLNYRRDVDIPKHRVNWNWIADLPFGRGKPIGRNARGLVDGLIGGWQIAGNGTLRSRYFALPTNMWGSVRDIEVYGKKHPIQDCRSGPCYDGWLYYNGYIPANRINSHDPRTGAPNGVMGVPDSYRPFQAPLIPTPKDGGSPADPNFPFYETNTVFVPLKNGTLQRTELNTNLHPMINQFVSAPMLWTMNASTFKSIRLREQMFLRLNIDFFNVFNMPGTNVPTSGTGIILNQTSANSPRILQLTGRLTW